MKLCYPRHLTRISCAFRCGENVRATRRKARQVVTHTCKPCNDVGGHFHPTRRAASFCPPASSKPLPVDTTTRCGLFLAGQANGLPRNVQLILVRRLICAFALLASACTISSEPGGVNAQFNPPIVYQHWQLDHYTMDNTGTKVCTIASGSKGVTVVFNHRATGDTVFVKSNYLMQPGITLSASVNGHNFMSYDTFFPVDAAKALVDNMEQGDKLYLEWTQKGGQSGSEPIRTQNIIMLDDFHAALKECRSTFK